MRLVLVGSVIVDLVLPIAALPERGGDLLADGARFRVGGGFYVLSAAAREGMPTAYAGRHGVGPFGDKVRAALAGIGSALLLAADASVDDADTGVCVVMVEPDGERTFVTSTGVEAALDASHLAQLAILPSDTVYVSGYDLAYETSGPAVASWIESLDAMVTLVVDPGPLVADIPAAVLDPVLARTNVFTLNQREWGLLATTSDLALTAGALRQRLAPDALLILRSGAEGAVITGSTCGDALVAVAAPTVHAVDTTGAGDVHTGTLIARRAQGDGPIEATRAAHRAAADHVSRHREG